MVPKIIYDPAGLATFEGPGGFTQAVIPKRSAQAIATALGIEFEEKRFINPV